MKVQASYVVQLFARRSRKIRKDNTIMKANVFYVASLAMLSTAWLCAMPVLAAETETEASTAFPVTVVDAYDNEVTLDAAPTSIVSLAPTDTEILYAIGAGEVMTGRTDYCNYPEERPVLDSIGTYKEPNMELILPSPRIWLWHPVLSMIIFVSSLRRTVPQFI